MCLEQKEWEESNKKSNNGPVPIRFTGHWEDIGIRLREMGRWQGAEQRKDDIWFPL